MSFFEFTCIDCGGSIPIDNAILFQRCPDCRNAHPYREQTEEPYQIEARSYSLQKHAN